MGKETKRSEKFLLHVDTHLQPQELKKRLQRPTAAPKTKLPASRVSGTRSIAWRPLVKKILNRFPFLWRYARWVYNHLYINRHLLQIQARQSAVENQQQQLARQMDRFAVAQNKIERKLEEYQRKLEEHRLAMMALSQPADLPEKASDTLLDQARLDRFYLHFENRFRGKESDIEAYQQHYLQFIPAIAKEKPVLDIGCGRGEWLAFLHREGFIAEGVDITRSMVEHCRAQGLSVRCEDALTTLEKAPPGSYAAITAFHVVEHLPFSRILILMEQAWRALDDGGVMILETPNPENLQVGSHTFWMDPTHIKPLPPALLAFAAEYIGFARTHIERLHPYPFTPAPDPQVRQIQSYFYREQDYALIAWKGDAI